MNNLSEKLRYILLYNEIMNLFEKGSKLQIFSLKISYIFSMVEIKGIDWLKLNRIDTQSL